MLFPESCTTISVIFTSPSSRKTITACFLFKDRTQNSYQHQCTSQCICNENAMKNVVASMVAISLAINHLSHNRGHRG
jgi:hypothetical protein